MKVAAIADTHGEHERLNIPSVGVLVCAGDCLGRDLDAVEAFGDWLSEQPIEEALVVPGNCDFVAERQPEATRSALEPARLLIDESVMVGSCEFYGSPWQPKFHSMALNKERGEALAAVWSEVPETVDCLVTHGPPSGILDRTSGGQRVGDETLYERIMECRPEAHVFGHIHDAYGHEEHNGIDFYNAAMKGQSDRRTPHMLEL